MQQLRGLRLDVLLLPPPPAGLSAAVPAGAAGEGGPAAEAGQQSARNGEQHAAAQPGSCWAEQQLARMAVMSVLSSMRSQWRCAQRAPALSA